MKIAIVYDAVYPYVPGGAERRYYELAVRLARAGHDVHWYGMRYWAGPHVMRRDGVTYHGVCRALPLYTRRGRRSILQAAVFGLATLKLLGDRFDVVDCCAFPFFSMFAARAAVAVRGGKLTSTWHEYWGREYWLSYLGAFGLLGNAVEQAAARVPSRIITVSATTAQRLSQVNTRNAVAVIPNGVDGKALRGITPAAPTCDVIYAGRLCDYKDVELLLRAVAVVTGTHPQITCRIVGGGPHQTVLQALARDLGIADHVEFTGPLPTIQQVYTALASARVLVLPSKREGFGIVAVEANALGVPVIVAAHPYNSAVDLIGRDNGLIASPQPAGVAAAIDQILREPKDRRKAACHQAGERYDWDTIADEYEALLAETVS